MQTSRTSAVVIITRPPETIACAMIKGSGLDVFAIFDSHSRPSYPSGAGLILNTSIDQTVARLVSILPAVDGHLLAEGDLQWQAQLFFNVASRIFVSAGPPGDMRDARRSVIESGVALLRLQAEIADLKQENARLISENKDLEEHVEGLEDALSVEKIKVTSLEASSKVMQCPQPVSARFTNPIAGPSWLARFFHGHKSSSQSGCYPTLSSPSTSADQCKTDEALALDLQQSFDEMQLEEALAASTSQANSTSQATSTSTSTSHTASTSHASPSSYSFPSSYTSPTSHTSSTSHTVPVSCDFSCAICMDDQPVDNSVELDCNHPICRDCIRGHICSKIEEHRFPVHCPICMAEKNVRPAGMCILRAPITH